MYLAVALATAQVTSADGPLVALHRLGLRLESSDDPESLVAAVVETAAETLRLPYVAIELATDGSWHVAHERGRRTDSTETFDVTVADHVVGRLVAAPRRDSRTMSLLDRRTLSDLARHSDATRCSVRPSHTGTALEVDVTDNGRGLGTGTGTRVAARLPVQPTRPS